VTRGKPTPTAGYPSKKAAVAAAMARGMSAPKEIARELDLSIDEVYSLTSQLRTRRQSGLGPWPPAKVDKARRLFATTMKLIAEALQVTPRELIENGLRDIVPPMLAGRLAIAIDGAVELPDPDDDERAGDEAELARLQEEESADADVRDERVSREPEAEPEREEDAAPGAAASRAARAAPAAVGGPAQLFKLRNEAGEFLHQHERGFTRLSKFIWRGTMDDVKTLRRKHPHFRDLSEEPVLQ
jgi:hypothetical protein